MSPPKSILVVDSDRNVRRSLALILENSCFSVIQANNARQALEILHRSRFDLVCLDIIQPDMDIDTLLTRIHEMDPQIPGLIITAFPSMENLSNHLFPINWSFFLKPIDPCILLDRMNEMFKLGFE
jgi:DNA-binding NtrC family response regulator